MTNKNEKSAVLIPCIGRLTRKNEECLIFIDEDSNLMQFTKSKGFESVSKDKFLGLKRIYSDNSYSLVNHFNESYKAFNFTLVTALNREAAKQAWSVLQSEGVQL